MRRSPSLWLELTPRCNLSCSFCYNPWRASGKANHPAQLDFSGLQRTVGRLLGAADFRYVALSGGEPLLYPQLGRLTAWLAENGQRTILTTNGRLLTDARLAALRTAGLDSVQVSLLGAAARTHDELAGRSSWHAAIQAIARARAAGLPTSATFIATARNVPELPGVVALVARLGLTYLVVNELQPVGSARINLEHLDVTSTAFDAEIERALVVAGKFGVRVNVIRSKSAGDAFATHGWSRWSLSPDGYLKVCNHSSETLGRVSEMDDEHLRLISHSLSVGEYERLAGYVNNCLCFDRAVQRRVVHG